MILGASARWQGHRQPRLGVPSFVPLLSGGPACDLGEDACLWICYRSLPYRKSVYVGDSTAAGADQCENGHRASP